jgi:hypothetical protein
MAQYHKCCYCETVEREHQNDVEHYRPKLRAQRGSGFPGHGYWWLAWTWSNLLFACAPCNRNAKGDQFPLDGGSVALQPEEAPPGQELPLIIDPGRENPVGHIHFRFFTRDNRPGWFPVARGGSRRGVETIRALKLDRPDLLDLYNSHVNEYIMPIVRRLRMAIEASDREKTRNIWQDEVTRWIAPQRPFTALSYDAIDYFFPRSVRRAWRLPLAQPR